MNLVLAGLFRDHAVLQRDQPLPVWGRAAPGARVRVTLGPRAASTISNAHGDFLLRLPALPAGGPHTLSVSVDGTDERIEVRDLFIGEVWLASGQSNMEWTLAQCLPVTETDIAGANFPGIRFFTVPQRAHLGPQRDIEGEWLVLSPETAPAFSAVAFACARRLHLELGVPVGIIVSAWGGTIIQSWLSRSALAFNPDTSDTLDRYEAEVWTDERWARMSKPGLGGRVLDLPADPGNSANARGWHCADLDDSGWKTIALPRTWQSVGHRHSGVFWFRRAIEIPADWVGKDLRLELGAIDKQDVAYVNGIEVGRTGSGFEEHHWNAIRFYPVPAGMVEQRKLVVVVRVYSFIYDGGMIGPASAMNLRLDKNAAIAIPLAGEWRLACEHDLGVVAGHVLPGHGERNSPHILFDNMIRPLSPYALRGAIWYQGESNADDRSACYARALRDLILDWRRQWGNPGMAFHAVQLTSFKPPQAHQPDSAWARIREAQCGILSLSHTGLAVTIELGEANDIHPKNKAPVGERLAHGILVSIHGRTGAPCGPIFDHLTREGDALRCHFRHAEAGLTTTDGQPPRLFFIADENREFHAAELRIEGATVLVRHSDILRPVAVRYAWADNPEGANLASRAGLFPASPFRSDRW